MLAGIGLIAMNTKILMDNSLANNGQQIGDSKLLIEENEILLQCISFGISKHIVFFM